MSRTWKAPQIWMAPDGSIHGGIPVDVAYLTSSPATREAEECQLDHTCFAQDWREQGGCLRAAPA